MGPLAQLIRDLTGLARNADSIWDYLILLWLALPVVGVLWVWFMMIVGLFCSAQEWLSDVPGGWKQKLGYAAGHGLMAVFVLSLAILLIWLVFSCVKAILHPVTFIFAGIALALFLLIKLLGRGSKTDAEA